MKKNYHSWSYLFISLLAVCTVFLFFQARVFAQSDDYQSLVQRNLEVRTQMKKLQGQYENLESERQVLIQHIKKLQKEKEFLLKKIDTPIQDTREIRTLRDQVKDLQDKLNAVTKERNRYKQELSSLKSQIESSEKAVVNNKAVKIRSLQREIKILQGEKRQTLDELRLAKKEIFQKEDALAGKIDEAVSLEKKTCQVEKDELESKYQEKLSSKQAFECQSLSERFEKEKVKIEGRVGQVIEDEKDKLRQENEALRQDLQDKDKKLDEAIAYVESERKSFKKELRNVLDDVTISEDDLQKLKNRALKAEAESRLLKQRLMEQAQLRAKLEEDILRLRKEKVQVKADAQEYINEELDQKVAEIVRQEKDKTKEKIKEIETAADKEMQEALAIKEEMAQKRIKEYKEETEQALKKAVAIERKMTDEKLRQFKENSRNEKVNMHYNLAVVYDKTGNYKKAEEEYLNVLELDPQDAETCYNLGILYDDKLNDNEKAIEYYKKYLELRPIGKDSAQVRRWMLHAEEEARLGPELR